jgi:pimeloyl-ACP methyl ester carboxylesterase
LYYFAGYCRASNYIYTYQLHKSLYSLLSNDYRIVVVEKAGYGFSDVADVARDINTVLQETRTALKLADINGPFVLCPHSMSGIEALYWAQMYPNEITAIIGLDMSVPQSYKDYQINTALINLAAFAANTGITRWSPSIAESDAIKYGTLSESEKELYRTIFYRRTATKSMLIELKQIKASAEIVALNGIPEVPMLLFSSNGQGTGWDEEQWRFFQKEYIDLVANGTLVELNCSHYVHDIEYFYISENIKKYLN